MWPEAPGLPRRGFLAGALASLASLAPLSSLIAEAAGCGGATEPAAPPQPKLPPLKTERLTDLMALAGLRWLILLRPREIASIPWLIPPIAAVVPEENFSRFAATTGIDLRQLHEAVIATYAGAADRASGAGVPDETTLYLGRHSGDPRAIERWVARRLTGAERRAADRPDLIRLSGKIGLTPYALALLGPDVFAIQHAGSASKGPARIASLYAEGKLKRSPTALSEDPLRALAARFGPAPLRAFALGPFEGELARGARGLLAGATAIGGAARPSAREGIALAIAVAGDFSTSGQAASEELLRAWDDLATGSFGHLLGLDRPVSPPLPTHAPDAVAIALELDPRKLAAGLAAATSGQIADIMR